MKKWLKVPGILTLLLFPFFVSASPSSVDRITDHIEPLIKSDYIKASYFTASSTTDVSILQKLSATLLGIGTSTPAYPLDVIGSIRDSNTVNDATNKSFKFLDRNYTNSQNDFLLVFGQSKSNANTLIFGGGQTGNTAATTISFFTGAGNNTDTGTARMTIDSTGGVTIPSLTTGVVKSTSGLLSNATNGTDFTLITAVTCSAGQFLNAFTASGVGTCGTASGGGTPGGSNTQVQFNDSGSFGGNSFLNFDKTLGILGVGGIPLSLLTTTGVNDGNNCDLLPGCAARGIVLPSRSYDSGTSNGYAAIQTFSATTSGEDGQGLDLLSGNGATTGFGGDITLAAGNSGTSPTARGGQALIVGGSGMDKGGQVNIVGGSAISGSNGDGGDIYLTPGFEDGIGVKGKVLVEGKLNLDSGLDSFVAILDDSNIASTDRTFTFPNASGTFCLTITCVGTTTDIGLARNMLLSTDNTGKIVSTSTPSIAAFFATSTTATSSIASNLIVGSTNTNFFTNAPLVLTTNTNNYGQVVLQNLSSGSTASADFVLGGNRMTNTTYYGDLGCNSSGNTDSSFTAYLANDCYLYSSDSNLHISTASSTGNSNIIFETAGTLLANERMRITSTGNIGIHGTTTPWGLISTKGGGTTTGVNLVLADSGNNPIFKVLDDGNITLSASQPATSTAITLDWSASPPQVEYRIGGSATTITLINATTSIQWGSRKVVWVCNPGGTAGALTWAGVEWIGTAPTQTTTANQCDVYSFDVTRATSTTAYKVAGSQGAGFQ